MCVRVLFVFKSWTQHVSRCDDTDLVDVVVLLCAQFSGRPFAAAAATPVTAKSAQSSVGKISKFESLKVQLICKSDNIKNNFINRSDNNNIISICI